MRVSESNTQESQHRYCGNSFPLRSSRIIDDGAVGAIDYAMNEAAEMLSAWGRRHHLNVRIGVDGGVLMPVRFVQGGSTGDEGNQTITVWVHDDESFGQTPRRYEVMRDASRG
jgi:hypothetical protein